MTATPLHDLMRECGLTAADFVARRRRTLFVHRSHEFYRRAIEAGHSTYAIARFAGRDHSTVIHGVRQARKRLAEPTPQIAPPTAAAPPPPPAPVPTPPSAPPARRPPSKPPKPPAPKRVNPKSFTLHGLYRAVYIRLDEREAALGRRFIHRVRVASYGIWGAVTDAGGWCERLCCDEEVPERFRRLDPATAGE